MRKRLVSIFIAVVMVLGMMPVIASAASSGTCGDNLTWILDDEGTLTIDGTGAMDDYGYFDSPFYDNKNIKAVIIHEGVTSIGDWAFYQCSTLKNINIPDSVIEIGSGAMNGTMLYDNDLYWIEDAMYINKHLITCKRDITDLTIRPGTKCIAEGAADGCKNLKTVIIPESMVSIGENAFYFCRELKSIIIPNNVIHIGSGAFEDCGNLASATIGNSVQGIGNSAFSRCKSLTSIVIPDSVNTIGGSAFYGCDSLTSVVIGNGTAFIGDSAFLDCSNLKSLIIGDNVTEIKDQAFRGCKSLPNIVLPECIKNIGYAAFRGCRGILNIAIPNGMANISEDVFYECTGLQSITIPNTVVKINYGAFHDCANLTDVYYQGTQEQWQDIEILDDNNSLINANIHYDGTTPETDPPKPVPTVDPFIPSTTPKPENNIVELYPENDSVVDLWNDMSISFNIKFDKEIESVGDGKIYLRDYYSGDVVREISADGDLDIFYIDENKKVINIDITLINAELPAIARGKKFYLTIAADTIKFVDGTMFYGIDNKDTWSFTTAYGLTQFNETVSFDNIASSFFDNIDINGKFKNGSQNLYPITSADLKNKIESILGKDVYNYWTAKKEDFYGACYGIATVEILNKLNMLDITEFDNMALTLYSMKTPRESQQANGVRDLINYYHLLQNADNYRFTLLSTDTEHANKYRNEEEFVKALKSIDKKIDNENKTKKPLLLSMGWMEDDSAKQHTVVLLSSRQSSTLGRELLIQDPNGNDFKSIFISRDYDHLNYSGHDIIAVKAIDITEFPSDWFIGHQVQTASLAAVDDVDYDLLKVIAYGDFTITNNRGETLTYKSGYLSGDMTVLDEDFSDSGDNNYAEFIYKVNKSDSYTFKSEDTRSGCTVKDGNTYISVNADNADNIVLDKSAGISVKGNDLSYSAYTTTLNGNMFAVSGETKESLDISFNQDGSADIQADTLKNVEFESFGDDTSYTFDGSGSVTVEENNSGGMTVTDADIHSETTFSNTIKENNGNADVTITNNTAEQQTGVAVVAEYTAGGALVNIDTIDLSLAGNESKTVQFTDKDVRYRTFVWDSLAGMKPLAGVAELTL